MPKRILIAEDDPSSLILLQLILEHEGGFEVVSATDGEAAWQLLESGTVFDVCIFDIMMPLLDGLGLTKRLRAHPLLCDQPVIICTALNERAMVAQAAALSISQYIVKPFARDHVIRQVKRVCAEQQAARKIEPFPRTARRLGITEPQLADFLGKLIKSTTELVQSFRAGPATDGGTPLIRVNALKGAAVNLGANALYRALAALETHCAAATKTPLAEHLCEIERESDRLNAAVSAATARDASCAA